jgi:hypothetical protein
MRFSLMLAALLSSVGCDSTPSIAALPEDAGDAAMPTEAGTKVDAGDAGSGGAGLLDCAWASGPNCWKATLMPASSCLPPSSDLGTMSADGTTCTYPTGTTVTFAPPLMIGPGATLSQFGVTTGGAPCLTYVENDAGTGSSVTTQAGTVSLTGNAAAQSLTVTCPDGSTYTGYARELGTCDGGIPSFDVGYGGHPASDGGPSHGQLSVTLNDTGAAGGTLVFNCQN